MDSRKKKHQIPLEVDPEIDHRDWRYSWEKPWRDGLTIFQPGRIKQKPMILTLLVACSDKEAATELIIADQQQLKERAERKKEKNVNNT